MKPRIQGEITKSADLIGKFETRMELKWIHWVMEVMLGWKKLLLVWDDSVEKK